MAIPKTELVQKSRALLNELYRWHYPEHTGAYRCGLCLRVREFSAVMDALSGSRKTVRPRRRQKS